MKTILTFFLSHKVAKYKLQLTQPTLMVLRSYALTVFFCLLLPTSNLFAQPVTLDPTFGKNGMTVIPNLGEIKLMDFDKSGNIVAMGVTKIDGTDYMTIVKANAEGIIDESFGTNGKVIVLDYKFNLTGVFGLKITTDNKIFITGNFGENKRVFMQFNENGSFDETFGDNGILYSNTTGFPCLSMNLESDDFIIFGGRESDSPWRPFISKYSYNWVLDETFGENGKLYLTGYEWSGCGSPTKFNIHPYCTKILKDHSIIVAGSDDHCWGTGSSHESRVFCKLNSNGDLVTGFANNGAWINDWDFTEYFYSIIEDNNENLLLVYESSPSGMDYFLSDGTVNGDFGYNGWGCYAFDFEDEKVQVLQNENKFLYRGDSEIHIVNDTNNTGYPDFKFNIKELFSYANSYRLHTMSLQTPNKLVFGGKFDDNLAIFRLNLTADTVNVITYLDNSIFVFPNPTTGELRVTSYELQVSGIEIFDVMGRKCHVSRVTCHENIDISGLSAGVYFVKIITDNGTLTKKIIKY